MRLDVVENVLSTVFTSVSREREHTGPGALRSWCFHYPSTPSRGQDIRVHDIDAGPVKRVNGYCCGDDKRSRSTVVLGQVSS